MYEKNPCTPDESLKNKVIKINIQQLNADFGIAEQVIFTKGKGGFPFIKVNNKKASALISIYGGQVLSFKPVNEAEDFMFISDSAYFQEGKAIKGGIPICWPWFGSASNTENINLPNHGFVRNNYWSVSSVDSLENGDTKIKLEFIESAKTKEIWSYCFYLSLEIIIGDSLTLNLLTRNTGNKAFFITEALHTYFNIGDATQVQVLGLEKTEYLDKAEDFIKVCQVGAITISEETDHIHMNVQQDLTINDPAFNRKIKITSSGNKNVVVWNPWAEGSAEIKDLESDDYKHFICVEIANTTSNKIKIEPDSEYRIITNYSLV